jgi:simple sugar transport system permease protein
MPDARVASINSGVRRAWRRLGDGALSPVTSSLLLSFVVVALILLATGTNPWTAYTEMWKGATSGNGPRTVINRAIPIVGMAIALSIPFRAGILNLGGEGQLVIGGLAAVLVAIHLPGPGTVVTVVAMAAGAAAGAVWALLPALGQTYLKLPILITSLLLNTPAGALTSYFVQYEFRDPRATSNATVVIPEETQIPRVEWLADVPLLGRLTGSSATMFLIVAIVVLVALFNKRTAPGYESFMSGINLKFARYGGVDVRRQTIGTMLVGGAVAGLVGGHMVLGEAFRFVEGDLARSNFAWTGLLVTLLAAHRALPALVVGIFFAGLQVGGQAMERSAGVSGQLALVLQAVVILALAMRLVLVRRRIRSAPPAAVGPEEADGAITSSAMATATTAVP